MTIDAKLTRPVVQHLSNDCSVSGSYTSSRPTHEGLESVPNSRLSKGTPSFAVREPSDSNRPNMQAAYYTSPRWAALEYLCVFLSRTFFLAPSLVSHPFFSRLSRLFGLSPVFSSPPSHAPPQTHGSSDQAKNASIYLAGSTTSGARTSLLKYS